MRDSYDDLRAARARDKWRIVARGGRFAWRKNVRAEIRAREFAQTYEGARAIRARESARFAWRKTRTRTKQWRKTSTRTKHYERARRRSATTKAPARGYEAAGDVGPPDQTMA